jgi:hypothetical protein
VPEQTQVRWYNPALENFEWREVPQSDEEALSLLEGSPHPKVHGYLWGVAGVRGEHHGGAHTSGRGGQGKAQLGSGPLAVLSAPCAVVFFCCLPYLFRIGEAGEAGRDRPVGAEQGDDARIAD